MTFGSDDALSRGYFKDEDENLELNTTYYYRVSTTATAPPSVRSRPSNVASARTGPVEVPGAPTLVNTNDENVDPKGPSRIDLTWEAPGSDGGGEITGYRIEYSNDDDAIPAAGTWRVLVANTMSDDVMYKDHGSVAELEAGDQRHYRVYAINSAGRGPASASARNADGTPAAPEEKPGAPTNLTARATGPSEIELSWTAPEDTSGAEITGYEIEYADLAEGSAVTGPAFGEWTDLVDGGTGNDDTTFTDDGSEGMLMAEATRRYRVTALNGSDNSDDDNNSNVASATTREATVPGMPTGLVLAPEAPVVGAQHQITLTSWVAPVNTGGAMITGYRIERSENGRSWETLVENTGNNTTLSHEDTTVPKANTEWHYRVSAINSEGAGRPSAAAKVFTLPAVAPMAPTGLVAWENGPTRIYLTWEAPAATGGEITGYKIEYSEDGMADSWMELVANTRSEATTYTDTSVTAETVRHYRVSAINSVDTSGPTGAANAVTGMAALKAPNSLLAQRASQRMINLTWTAASTGNGYLVERSENGRTGWTSTGAMTITDLTTEAFKDEDENLELNTTYYYRVSTSGDSVRSKPSNVANARTGPVEVPGAPTLMNDDVDPKGPSRIDLTWEAPGSDGGGEITGYRIEYSNDDDAIPAAGTWRALVANTMSDDVMYRDHGSVAELEAGDQRHYRVSAINSAGRGAASESARNAVGTPEGAVDKPEAPTGLTARATGPMEIELSWTAPEDTSGAEITGYEIEYADLAEGSAVTGPAFGEWTDLVDGGTGNDDTTFTDDGSEGMLMAEATRRYRVTALNGSDNNDDDNNSNVASATTREATVPGMPTGLMLAPAVPGVNALHQITLNWVAPVNTGGADITGYRIERSENGSSWPAEALVPDTEKLDSDNSINVIEPEYIDTSVPKANTRWYYRVSAINAEGVGRPSAAATASTLPAVAPVKPTGLAAWEIGPTRIVLVWQAPEGTGGEITGYKIEYSEDGMADSWMELVANTMSDATTYTDTSVPAGTARYYRVSAINSAGESPDPTGDNDSTSALTGTTAITLTVDGPVIASHAENDTDMVATYMKSGPGADKATWSLSGADARYFTIPGGVLKFRSAPDFEMPRGQAMTATNTNEYMVTVKASYGTDMDEIMVTVTVGNVEEIGMVTLSPMAPSVDTEITATLTDEDGGITGTTWQWSKSMTMDGTFTVIAMATSMTYTPVEAHVGYYLRATVMYTDGHDSDKMAMETTASMVTAADPLLVKYDTNGDRMIDRNEAIAALRSYRAGEVSRSDAIAVLRLYRGS